MTHFVFYYNIINIIYYIIVYIFDTGNQIFNKKDIKVVNYYFIFKRSIKIFYVEVNPDS